MDMQAVLKDLRAEIAAGKDPHEVVDAFTNTALDVELQAILDELGDVDLSAPIPDLKQGWSRVRGQLAYNALYHHVVRTRG